MYVAMCVYVCVSVCMYVYTYVCMRAQAGHCVPLGVREQLEEGSFLLGDIL